VKRMKQTHDNRLSFVRRVLAAPAILLVFAGLGVTAAHLLKEAPENRSIAIEAFRYGFSPSRISVNRGDHLRLTFSTRDTGQSFFLQDYDLHVVVTPGSRLVEVYRLSRPDDPPTRVETVELTAGLPGWRGMLVSKSQFRNHTYNGPLHGTERGDLLVAPNYLFAAGLGLLCALPLLWVIPSPRLVRLASTDRPLNLFERVPGLKALAKQPSLQTSLMIPMLAVFYFLVLAGFIGTKVSGRNVGPMVVWIIWLPALILVLVPLGGRFWCLVCPLPTVGELLQRRRMGGAQGQPADVSLGHARSLLRWPRWLSNAWPRLLFFLLLGTFSTALVALPPATSWMLLGLAFLALLTSFFPEQRLFCRYLCPINSFIGLYSMTGRLMARSVSPSKCAECQERFCLTGSAKGWGCPYGLCMGEVNRNNDCGLCTECIKTCAYDNVALFWRRSRWDQEITSYGEAWQAIVMMALAAIYCVVNLGAWDQLRDWIDIVDKRNWRTFWLYAACIWALCLGVLPLLVYTLTWLGGRVSGTPTKAGTLFRASTAALVPVGLAWWMAFALSMLLSMVSFVLQSLSDPFGWGWDLLHTAGTRWHILWAPAIPWLQVMCVLIGFAYSLRTLRNCWEAHAAEGRRSLIGSIPLAAFLWAASGGMIAFFAR
jgi:hypothetical protein